MDHLIDYFEHTGLSYQQIRELKHQIDTSLVYPHFYFLTLTWEENPSWGYDLNGREFEERREKQVRDYFLTLAKKTKSKPHLKCYSAISRPNINKHFHSIVTSTNPIPASIAKSIWKEGRQKDFEVYEPDWGEKNFQDPDRGAVQYIFGKHHQHRIIPDEDVWCPGKRKCCKRGNCPHRSLDYKMRGVAVVT